MANVYKTKAPRQDFIEFSTRKKKKKKKKIKSGFTSDPLKIEILPHLFI